MAVASHSTPFKIAVKTDIWGRVGQLQPAAPRKCNRVGFERNWAGVPVPTHGQRTAFSPRDRTFAGGLELGAGDIKLFVLNLLSLIPHRPPSPPLPPSVPYHPPPPPPHTTHVYLGLTSALPGPIAIGGSVAYTPCIKVTLLLLLLNNHEKNPTLLPIYTF